MAVAVNLSLAASLGASWFHIEGPETVIEPDRDHGDGVRICSVEKNPPNPYSPTFPVGPVVHIADFHF